MNLSKWLWILISLALWALLAGIVSLYLIKERAVLSLGDLSSSLETGISQQNKTALSNIQIWLRISALIKSTGLGKNPEALSTTFNILKSSALSGEFIEIPSKLECPECSQLLQSNLKNILQLISDINTKTKESKNTLQLLQTLNEMRKNQIELHSLLAKDFAELLGSTCYYQTKGKQDLVYYKDGPFKWLPLLDESSGTQNKNELSEQQASLAIEDLSENLESLKKNSKSIVQEFLEINSKIKENSDKISAFNTEISKIRLKISNLLLDGLKAEVSNSKIIEDFWT